MSARVLYSDLDGTMVGPAGCFFRAEDRSPTLEPARALVDLHAAGVTLVLVSGRTRSQLVEACRIFGADGYVGELGSVLGWDSARRHEVLRGAMPEGLAGTPAAALHRLGVVDALFARYPGRLEYHAPWHADHEGDVMLRGRVDPAEVQGWLAGQGYGWLRLRDNGVLPPRRSSTLAAEALPAHVYHLMPAGLSKGSALARDLARRGLDGSDAVAVGDSLSDLTMAAHVGRMHLTANGLRHAGLAAAATAYDNVAVTAAPVGLGWVQAVRAALGC